MICYQNMKITIDTTQDSHENIKKAIKMLQSIVGDEALTNSLDIISQSQQQSSPIVNIFGDTAQAEEPKSADSDSTSGDVFGNVFDSNEQSAEAKSVENAESTEDDDGPIADKALFADLFTEEELKKMESEEAKEAEAQDKGLDEDDEDESYTKKDSGGVVEFY